MADLLEIWDIKLAKEGEIIELHYPLLDFIIDVDYKHGVVRLTKKK